MTRRTHTFDCEIADYGVCSCVGVPRIRVSESQRKSPNHIKISAYDSTRESQSKSATCVHEWEELPTESFVLEYIRVEARCVKCKTFKGVVDGY